MSSYLTPDWLLSDINQLLSGTRKGLKEYGRDDILSQKDFEDKYLVKREKDWDRFARTGSFSGDDMYEYKDWTQDVEGGYDWGATGSNIHENRYLSKKGKAYNNYLESLGYSPEEGYGQGTSNIFDREQFSGDVAEAQGVGVEARPPSESFTQFTPQMFKKLRTEYYQPQIESGRQSLIDKLMQKGRLTAAKGGGFAGYGGRERGRRGLEEQYRGGVEDIYAGVEEERGKSLQNIYDVLGQYETIGEE